jgi:hypothetical protein
MFERFTPEARAVVVEAQAECRRRHDRAIGPEHLLLGLWFDADNPAVRVLEQLGLHRDELRDQLPRSLPDRDALRALGIDIDEIRRRVEAAFGPGALESTAAGCRGPSRSRRPESRRWSSHYERRSSSGTGRSGPRMSCSASCASATATWPGCSIGTASHPMTSAERCSTSCHAA